MYTAEERRKDMSDINKESFHDRYYHGKNRPTIDNNVLTTLEL